MKIRLFTACATVGLLFSVVLNLQGCIAVPVLAAANMVMKSGTANFTLEGKESAAIASFREAAIKAGGMITNSNNDYVKAEFSDTAVKVEIQKVRAGEYQVVGSSNTTVARAYELKDNIGETTKMIVDHMVSNGFRVTSSSRKNGV